MKELTQYFSNKSNYKKIIRDISPQSVQLVTGISESARASLMAVIAENQNKPVIIFAANLHQANLLYSDLSVFYNENHIYVYNANDMIHTQLSAASPEELAERIETLEFLLSEKPGIIIIPIAGARRLLPPKEVYQEAHLVIDNESEIDLDDFIQKLVSNGYIREQIIAKPGEFSVRGGIIDIYPLTEKYPVRIELFDIEVDSIRSFSVEDQRSIEQLDEVVIPPATESIIPQENWADALQRIKFAYEKTNTKLEEDDDKQKLAKNLMPVIESLEKGEWHENFTYYTSFIFEDTHSIIDYISEDAVILYNEYPRILETHQKLEEEETLWLEGQANQFRLLSDQVFSQNFIDKQRQMNQPRIYFSIVQKGMGSIRFTTIHSMHYREMQNFFGQIPMIKAEIESWEKRGYDLLIMTENEERATHVQEMLAESEIKTEIIDAQTPISSTEIQILPFTVQKGFELIEEKVAVLTENEMFNRRTKRRHRQLNISNAERIKSYNELNAGDYVVHENHGIGKYIGMETLEIKGVHQDYLAIQYQNSDRVLIPVTQLNLIQKYVSAEGKQPKIHKLGGTTWAKTKNRVRKQVEDIADELIELYAERESQKGFAFSQNDEMYREFEEAFPYVETPDQLRSIKEITKDMEKEKPMDRLLVGDVGFGKTEVAMRAAFKAVQDGKQVAFLVPTTVLAQQHYESFTERFVDFPIKIEMLSRFRTQKQSEEIADGLRKGQIDIIIGTHRVLSKDVKFQDLGLLVVDEEQRFGVKHKERLKRMKKDVDVLTLTATPIPRTLHMSLVGARDLSVIETPPANRYPVQTYVVGMDGLVVREAIEREMARGGQVFFLHNRVQTIERRVRDIEELVPHARVAYIHGRLSERELERILYDFLQGEYDVLVTTTIIETGIDMPNVNTLLVEDADYMGLSQLYQLRGRIGRSNRVAYAYFMYEPTKLLNEESQKRLQAIKDFTELGSGFKIAMRDLSIRGAGNLLGQQQSGFIDSVGFDLYSQMLQEAVEAKQGKRQTEKTVVEIDLNVDAYIPSHYVSDERQKIELYKRIRSLSGEEEYTNLQDEFIDRFGDFPQEVDDLLMIGLIKFYSERVLVESIKQNRSKLNLTFSVGGTTNVPMEEIFRALDGIPLKVDVQPDKQLSLIFNIKPGTESYEWLQYILKFVQNLYTYYEEHVIEDEEDETDSDVGIPVSENIDSESEETGA
jgi:transcription-repair coupling factor (superfamily II helicase)